ncbi:MAG: Rne/Rng family ribonuclease [Planctomycetota bacterium]|jgi:ribonuclease E
MTRDETLMLVNAVEKEETRIAVVSRSLLEDYHVARSSKETLVGNIYKGRVENVHASLQAAFVSIGLVKNAFLHVSETIGPGETPYKPPPRRRRRGPPRPKRHIQNLLRVGEQVIVQVIRDAFGEKGPSVTMNISLPGRFLVLTPLSKHVGVSRKIESRDKRARLRQLLRDFRTEEDDVGFIVRTASSDTAPQELRADYEYLNRLWRAVDNRARSSSAPAVLYQETEIVLRTVRDYFTRDIERVIVDDRAVHQRLVDFFDSIMPKHRDRLEFHGEPMPLFHKYEIEQQIEQLNQGAVPLPSGGSVVIEQTEALTAIDVNSGRWVRETNPEDLAYRTNQEAAREIMRQLRLRDMGGIIAIDFIDMKSERHRHSIEERVRQEAGRDRAQIVVLPMSQFCLMQIARQKIRPSVQLVSHEACPACGGTGVVKNIESIALEIMRALKSTLEREDIAVVEARVSPDVASYLRTKMDDFREMEEKYNKRIHISAARDLATNRVEFTCYDLSGDKVFDIVR